MVKRAAEKGNDRFAKPGKLNPRNMGPYRIKRRVGEVAYELDLSADKGLHNVFHVSMLRKYVRGPDVPQPERLPDPRTEPRPPSPEPLRIGERRSY